MSDPDRKPPHADNRLARHCEDLEEFGFDLPDDQWLAHLRATVAPAHERTIGPYEIVSEVNRGGQGIVYRARERATGREVALKLMLAGDFATPEMRARFEREVKAAAGLKHPGIVTIYGTENAGGQPVLAMEWIEGMPINQWAWHGDDRLRNSTTVLEVFVEVCEAIQHAHQRGILHRDLKPSNVMIDSHGKPKVVDFGVAKILSEEPTSRLTHTAEFVGTPAYAAPEQLNVGARGLDARGDVYSLGVILYELLTGRLPYDVGSGLATAVHAIQNVTPRNPSAIGGPRSFELDTIILKALAKDPTDRYQSVDALAEDVRRLRDGLPILAVPPSALYQLRKLVSRHRVRFALSALVLLLTVLLAVVSSVQNRELSEQRNLEVAARQETENALALVLELLAATSPHEHGRKASVMDVVKLARRKLEDHVRNPELCADLRATIGMLLYTHGRFASAAEDLGAALQLRLQTDADDLVIARTEHDLGRCLIKLCRYGHAEATLRSCLARRRLVLPGDDPAIADTLTSLTSLLRREAKYAEAHGTCLEAIAIRGADSHATEERLELARLHIEQFDLDSAEHELEGLRDRLDSNPRKPTIEEGDIVRELARIAAARGDLDRALAGLSRVMKIRRHHYEERHPRIGATHVDLAVVHAASGHYKAAENHIRTAQRILLATREPGRANAALVFSTFAMIEAALGRLGRAEKHAGMAVEHHAALAMATPAYGATLIEFADILALRSAMARDQGRDAMAAGFRERAGVLAARGLAMLRTGTNPKHPALARALTVSARIASQRDAHDQALAGFTAALTMLDAAFPRGHPQTAAVLNILGSHLASAGAFTKAHAHFERALSVCRRNAIKTPVEDEIRAKLGIARCTLRASELEPTPATRAPALERARALFQEVAGTYSSVLPADLRWRVTLARATLGTVQYQLGRTAAAERNMKQAYSRLSRTLAPTHWAVLQAREYLDTLTAAAQQPGGR